jgi:hypothetical protein
LILLVKTDTYIVEPLKREEFMNDFYVYSLTDPRDGKTFYIGKGVGKRIKTYYKTDPAVSRATKVVIEAIRLEGLDVDVRIVDENLTEHAAVDLEERLIRQYGRRTKDINGTLTNVASKGHVTSRGANPQYRTIQVAKDVKDQITDYCNRHDLKIGRFIERIFLNEVSGSQAGKP